MDKCDFIEMLDRLQKTPLMFLMNNNYNEFTAFIMGYEYAMYKITGTSFLETFNDWMQQNIGVKFSIHSFHYIKEYLCNNNEEKAKELLVDKIKEYLDDPQRPGNASIS